MPNLIFRFFLLIFPFILLGQTDQEFPVLYKGRFRPADAYARLWLYDHYHSQTLKSNDLASFNAASPSALEFLLNLHVMGHTPWDEAPLFWIQSAELKKLANLNVFADRFSYQEIKGTIYTSKPILQMLAVYEFLQAYLNPLNHAHSERFELNRISPGLWVQLHQSDLKIITVPMKFVWPSIKPGEVIGSQIKQNAEQLLKEYKQPAEDLLALMGELHQFEQIRGQKMPSEELLQARLSRLNQQRIPPKQIASELEKQYPLIKRLQSAGTLFNALPANNSTDWYSLHTLKVQIYSPEQNKLVPVGNFTRFSEDHFTQIRQTYLDWERSVLEKNDRAIQKELFNKFSTSMRAAYQTLAGKSFLAAEGKSIHYPTLFQLKLESLYYQYPWVKGLVFLYALSTILLIFAYLLPNPSLSKVALVSLWITFSLHTLLLISRSYIMNRPPVTNMFETVLYVPWIAVLIGLSLNFYRKHKLILIAASLASIILLVILELTDLNHSMDNVQAVLDSQFWLIIHVLMVVGSYGVFILGAILGHFYLGLYLRHSTETPSMCFLSQFILQTMYLGLALLIPGTILGGVWAAESWGRFWDWDPKESWAFISICLYLIWVHAYRYHRIGSFGLAFGAVSGLLAISFTWYGVNYILGTGLHSYGFGSGGEIYYYAFLIAELAFLAFMLAVKKRKELRSQKLKVDGGR